MGKAVRLSRGAGVSLWRQIREAILRDIVSGALVPGDRLPTEITLAARFGVNRHTVRQALGDLEEAGLLRIDQGRGSFVQEAIIDYAIGRRTRFSENLAKLSKSAAGRFIESRTEPAAAQVAKALGLRKGAAVTWIKRIGMADGRPINISTHYFAAARFPGIDEAVRRKGSITGALKEFGVLDYTRKFTRVTARLPTQAEARVLEQTKNQPLLISESINVDACGDIVEFALALFAGDRVQFVVET